MPTFQAGLPTVTVFLVFILSSNTHGAAAQLAAAATGLKVSEVVSKEHCSGSFEHFERSYAEEQSGLIKKSADQIAAEWDKVMPYSDKTSRTCGQDRAFVSSMFRSKFVAHAQPCAKIIQLGGEKKWLFGSETDGAKFLCADNLPKGNCIVYSLGSRKDFSFEIDVVAKMKCKVHTFDCTVGDVRADELPHGVTFHPWCIGSEDALKPFVSDLYDSAGAVAQYYTMSTIMRMLGHSYVDVLKMDIERFEFDVLKSLACPGCFGQAAIEFHLQNINGMHGQAVSYKEWNDVWSSVVCENGLRPFSYDNAHCECCCEYSFLSVIQPANVLNATSFYVEETGDNTKYSLGYAGTRYAHISSSIRECSAPSSTSFRHSNLLMFSV